MSWISAVAGKAAISLLTAMAVACLLWSGYGLVRVAVILIQDTALFLISLVSQVVV